MEKIHCILTVKCSIKKFIENEYQISNMHLPQTRNSCRKFTSRKVKYCTMHKLQLRLLVTDKFMVLCAFQQFFKF